MSARERAVDRGTRRARQDLVAVGSDIRTARISAGLSQGEVGRACGLSYSTIGRIERAVLHSVTPLELARVGAVVGLDVRVKAYPGGNALRDAGQLALFDRLRGVLDVGLELRLEVPIRGLQEQRAWDAVIGGFASDARYLPVEVETRLYDIQAQIRRLQLKARDAGVEHVILLVAGTRSNRRIIRETRPLMADMFPVSGRRALAALRSGRHPGGSAVMLL